MPRRRVLAVSSAVAATAVATAIGVAVSRDGEPSSRARGADPSRGDAPVPRPVKAPAVRTVLNADFEPPSVTVWAEPQEHEPGRITQVESVDGGPVRRGSRAARFEVRAGDDDVAGSGDGERAEIFLSAERMGEAREQWWAWSTYFPDGFDAPTGEWNVFTQFHNTGDADQANVHFDVRDRETIGLRVIGGDPEQPMRRDWALAELETGRWYDFLFHVRWAPDGDGFVEVFVDGLQAVERTATPTTYDGQFVYLKQGYYRGPHDGTTVVFHDGTRRVKPEFAD